MHISIVCLVAQLIHFYGQHKVYDDDDDKDYEERGGGTGMLVVIKMVMMILLNVSIVCT